MNKHTNVVRAAMPAIPIPSGPVVREQLLCSAIDLLMTQPKQHFKLFQGLENEPHTRLHELETAGTMLEPLNEVLKAFGFPTDGTVRCLMQPPLELKDDDIHSIACNCDRGDAASVTGRDGASLLRCHFKI